MLPKVNRLTKKKDFETVFKNGKSVKSDFLIFRIVKNHLQENRFGFVVSKKVSPRAVVRNRVKRRLRKAAYNTLQGIKGPVDVVVITLPGIEKKKYTDIETMLAAAFRKYT